MEDWTRTVSCKGKDLPFQLMAASARKWDGIILHYRRARSTHKLLSGDGERICAMTTAKCQSDASIAEVADPS